MFNSVNTLVAEFYHTLSWWLQVKLEQGLQVLKIFKDHVFNTSILDDFGFYDNREKIMQERKSRCHQPLEKVHDYQCTLCNDPSFIHTCV